jgi:hypothetical protein
MALSLLVMAMPLLFCINRLVAIFNDKKYITGKHINKAPPNTKGIAIAQAKPACRITMLIKNYCGQE